VNDADRKGEVLAARLILVAVAVVAAGMALGALVALLT
jgi:hypothetical protein